MVIISLVLNNAKRILLILFILLYSICYGPFGAISRFTIVSSFLINVADLISYDSIFVSRGNKFLQPG